MPLEDCHHAPLFTASLEIGERLRVKAIVLQQNEADASGLEERDRDGHLPFLGVAGILHRVI